MEYLLLLALILYLAPWMAAEGIEHPDANTILALTLGLGWTGIGWLVAARWVYRDWPRETPPPQLVLLGPDSPAPRTRSPAAALGRAALAAGTLFAVGALFLALPISSAEDASLRFAVIDRPDAQVRLGPGAGWPVVGPLPAGCRVRVLEYEGAWRRVWRLPDCVSGESGRNGWIRMEMLRAVPAPEDTDDAPPSRPRSG